jgi:hypothetical protein
MNFAMRTVLRLTAGVMLMKMAFASVASAQDVMQLDLMFRESLLRRTASDGKADDQSIRQRTGEVLRSVRIAQRHARRHRHEITSPASANGGL